MNKIEQITSLTKLYDDEILSSNEAMEKIKLVLRVPILKESIFNLGNKKRKHQTLSEKEKTYILGNLGKKSVSSIAREIGRSYSTVYNMVVLARRKTNLPVGNTGKKRFTEAEDSFIKEHSTMSQAEIAKLLGRAKSSIRDRLVLLRRSNE